MPSANLEEAAEGVVARLWHGWPEVLACSRLYLHKQVYKRSWNCLWKKPNAEIGDPLVRDTFSRPG